ncbi:hypothetical protein Ahy_A08g038579 isoform D [Arachis hypogaea]|uniref:Uncharacterized protein n=1 Tax=Arachis hypogaea TaxID=3818 RepID=A0A445BTZ9_ARAHY|nr:hypothetical protein Ahy_A08g038579 isoform D [Arachis hypogaea]
MLPLSHSLLPLRHNTAQPTQHALFDHRAPRGSDLISEAQSNPIESTKPSLVPLNPLSTLLTGSS